MRGSIPSDAEAISGIASLTPFARNDRFSDSRSQARLPDGQARESEAELRSAFQRILTDIIRLFEEDGAARRLVDPLFGSDYDKGTVVDPALFEEFKGRHLLLALALRKVIGEAIAIPSENPPARALLEETNSFLASQGETLFLIDSPGGEPLTVSEAVERLQAGGAHQLQAVVRAGSATADEIRGKIGDSQIITEGRLQSLLAQDSRFADLASQLEAHYTAIARSA